jgi:hypothetical protein
MATASGTQRVSSSAFQIEWLYEDPKGGDGEPPISAAVLSRIERELRGSEAVGGVVRAAKCTSSSCSSATAEIVTVTKAWSGRDITCKGKCVSKKVGSRWVKVCSFSCSGDGIQVKGTIR